MQLVRGPAVAGVWRLLGQGGADVVRMRLSSLMGAINAYRDYCSRVVAV